MEELFKCQFTGEVFNNRLDCLESEYVHGDERKKFVELVDQFLDEIKNKFGAKVNRETLEVYDKRENYINDRMVHWRHLKFNFTLNGLMDRYCKESDPVGDGRWNWDVHTLSDMVNDFEKTHLLSSYEAFSGLLYSNMEGDDYNYENVRYLGDRKIEDILNILEGKNIEIRILASN